MVSPALVSGSTHSLRGRPDPLQLAAVGSVAVGVTVEIVVPVHNEVRVLEQSVSRLRDYLNHDFPFSSVVTIADNASSDGTWRVARRLAATMSGVKAVRLEEKGRGLALAHVWGASDAAVVAYMDVDLSTKLSSLLPLVAAVISGHSEVAIGTRLAVGSSVGRGPIREIISRSYNSLLRMAVGEKFSDAQCGFKALSSSAARQLLPSIQDGGWFFDTELLIAAERAGMRVHEVPVDWIDDPDSRVKILRTAWGDLTGLCRVAGGVVAKRLLVLLVLLALLVGVIAAWVPAPDRLGASASAVLASGMLRRVVTYLVAICRRAAVVRDVTPPERTSLRVVAGDLSSPGRQCP